MQASLAESADPLPPERVALGRKQRPFELRGSAESTDGAGGADHPVVRQPRIGRFAKDVAYRPRSARPARPACDIAIGRHPPDRNGGDHAEYAIGEWRTRFH